MFPAIARSISGPPNAFITVQSEDHARLRIRMTLPDFGAQKPWIRSWIYNVACKNLER